MQNISKVKDEEEVCKEIKEAGYFCFKAEYSALANDFHWY